MNNTGILARSLLAVVVFGVVPGAFGQSPARMAPGPRGSWDHVLEVIGPDSGLREQAALLRVKQILGWGGATRREDKAFLNEWAPKFFSEGALGRAPTPMEKMLVQRWFPKLSSKGDWRVTGEPCSHYNCISWVVGTTGEQLWPSNEFGDYDAFYLTYGYIPLGPGESRDDADIAFWTADGTMATHACRHVAGDIWESKLGTSVRILHRLDELEGNSYGHAARFYRKATPEELQSLGVTPKIPDGNGQDPCARAPAAKSVEELGSPYSNRRR